MMIDRTNGRIAFPEFGLVVDPSLTRSRLVDLATGAVALPRVRHDPSFRYQLPSLPQPESDLYVMLRFHYERLGAIELLHHADRFDDPAAGGSESRELARQTFHERWLATEFGLGCQRYRWGEVLWKHDPEGRATSISIEYIRANAWQAVGRTAGRLWGAVSTSR